MERKSMYQRFVEEALAKGATELPPDHPVYSEPPSIMFLSRTSKPSEQKDTTPASSDSQSDTGSPRKKKKKK